jgi:Ran GTPase-activating protein (RanGAP) involved in mRNA processing and transport
MSRSLGEKGKFKKLLKNARQQDLNRVLSLNVADNDLDSFDFSKFPNLQTLDISSNRLNNDNMLEFAKALNRTSNKLTMLKIDRAMLNISHLKGDESVKSLKFRGLEMASGIIITRLIQSNPFLTSLDVSNNNLGGYKYKQRFVADTRVIEAFAQVLKSNNVLTSLNLENIKLCGIDNDGSHNRKGTYNPAGIQALASALSEPNAVLTTLNLANNVLCGIDQRGDGTYDASGITALAEMLKVNEKLVNLVLTDNHIGDVGAVAISGSLKSNKTLKTLMLMNCNIGPSGVKALSEGSELTKLSLAENDLTNSGQDMSGIQAFAVSLNQQHAMLTHLDLTRTFYSATGNTPSVTALANALKDNKVLTSLYFAYNLLGSENAVILADALNKNNVLTSCTLYANNIDTKTAEILANIGTEKSITLTVKYDKKMIHAPNRKFGPADGILFASDIRVANLISLDLSYNALCGIDQYGYGTYDASGIEALAKAFEASSKLTSCTLIHNKLDIESATMLAKIGTKKNIMLSGIRHDETNVLFNSKYSDKIKSGDAILIASDLRVSTVLMRLHLHNNEIGDEGAVAIGESLKSNKSLEELRISEDKIGPTGAKALAEALKVNTVLTSCTLIKNQLDIESATMLAEIGTERRIMLSGIEHDQTEANFQHQNLQPADGILIASDLRVSAVLTRLSLAGNNLTNDGKDMSGIQALAAALSSGSAVLTSLDLGGNNLNAEAGKALASMLEVNRVLTSLDLTNNRICGLGWEGGTYDPSGIQALASALAGNAVLKQLDVKYNNLNNEARNILKEAVRGREGFFGYY